MNINQSESNYNKKPKNINKKPKNINKKPKNINKKSSPNNLNIDIFQKEQKLLHNLLIKTPINEKIREILDKNNNQIRKEVNNFIKSLTRVKKFDIRKKSDIKKFYIYG